jgi:hypothetical protein
MAAMLHHCPSRRLPSTVDYTVATPDGYHPPESSLHQTPFLIHRISGENNRENQEENLSEFIPNRESWLNPNKIKFPIESNELEIESGSC